MVSCKFFRVDWHACDPSWSRPSHGQTDRQRDAVAHTDAWSFPAYNCSLITQSIPANGWLHNQRPLKQNDSPVASVMEAKWNLSTCLRRAVWWDLHLGKREQERKREMEGERHGGNTLLTQHINHRTHGERKRKKCAPSFRSSPLSVVLLFLWSVWLRCSGKCEGDCGTRPMIDRAETINPSIHQSIHSLFQHSNYPPGIFYICPP